jgi:hypothetical protein
MGRPHGRRVFVWQENGTGFSRGGEKITSRFRQGRAGISFFRLTFSMSLLIPLTLLGDGKDDLRWLGIYLSPVTIA